MQLQMDTFAAGPMEKLSLCTSDFKALKRPVFVTSSQSLRKEACFSTGMACKAQILRLIFKFKWNDNLYLDTVGLYAINSVQSQHTNQ